MALGHQTVVFDVHDCKVYVLLTDTGASPTYGPAIDVPGIASIDVSPNFVTAELKGDAKVIAKKGRVDKMTLSATYGKVSIDVLHALLGGAITDTASTQANWKFKGANSLAYFKLIFKIDDVETGLGDVVVTLWKCQLTGGTLVGGSSDNFGQPTLQLEGIPCDSSDDMIDVDLYSTLQTLPA